MCGKKCILISLIILVVVAIPLSVTSFIFGQTYDDDYGCDLTNVAGHDLSKYLLGINITGITAILVVILVLLLLLFLKQIPFIGKIASFALLIIIGGLWLFVAIYILYGKGSNCLKIGFVYFGYSGVLVALAILTIADMFCC